MFFSSVTATFEQIRNIWVLASFLSVHHNFRHIWIIKTGRKNDRLRLRTRLLIPTPVRYLMIAGLAKYLFNFKEDSNSQQLLNLYAYKEECGVCLYFTQVYSSNLFLMKICTNTRNQLQPCCEEGGGVSLGKRGRVSLINETISNNMKKVVFFLLWDFKSW